MSSCDPSPCWMGIAGVGVLVASCSTVSMIPSTSSAMLAPPPESASKRKAYNIKQQEVVFKRPELTKLTPVKFRTLFDKFPVKNQVRKYINIWYIDSNIWLLYIRCFKHMIIWNNVFYVRRHRSETQLGRLMVWLGEPENGKEKNEMAFKKDVKPWSREAVNRKTIPWMKE